MAGSGGGGQISGPGKGGSFNLGTGGTIGLSGSAGVGGSVTLTCPPALTESPVFADQALHGISFQRELYSWTTEEQEAEIRAGGVLFTRSEREGLGAGFAFDSLRAFASTESSKDQADLAALLTSAPFAKGRYAWPHPWATRLGWPGESYGNRLLRIVLRADAWLAVFASGRLSVIDASNGEVSIADVLAQPGRLAGLFFIKDAYAQGPVCGGTFESGGLGYREFLLSNEEMVEEWSLGTEVIRARLSDDIARLTRYFDRMRACPESSDATRWNLRVCCDWQYQPPGTTEQGNYEAALSMPSENYLPTPVHLAALIETLQGDLFEPDPIRGGRKE
jgi:hypothetical protein